MRCERCPHVCILQAVLFSIVDTIFIWFDSWFVLSKVVFMLQTDLAFTVWPNLCVVQSIAVSYQ